MVNLESSYYHSKPIAKCLLSGGLKVHAMYGNTELGVSNLTTCPRVNSYSSTRLALCKKFKDV
jgi:hypothetical protein